MQSIYDGGVGDIVEHISDQTVFEVQKQQNRRNPQAVIALANKLRTDSLQQTPSIDISAPNMIDGQVSQGSIKFLYATNVDVAAIKKTEHFAEWNFDDSKNTKELNLTHNLVASKAGFEPLMEIYDKDPIIALKTDLVKKIKSGGIAIDDDATFEDVVNQIQPKNQRKELKVDVIKGNTEHNVLYNILKDRPFAVVRKMYLDKDSLIDDKKDNPDEMSGTGSQRDPLIKQLFKIQEIIECYERRNFNLFIRKTSFRISSVAKKKEVLEIINTLNGMLDSTIEEVINYADRVGLCYKDDHYTDFIGKSDYLFFRVGKVKYRYFKCLYVYLEGNTPFSTQHKVKGSEYDNVFVILDNGNWNNYNFKKLFGEEKGSENALVRSQKIFYVCCTRAKKNLIVYFDSPSEIVLENAKKLFDSENVACCDSMIKQGEAVHEAF